MPGPDRCDEIIRLIDEVLEDVGADGAGNPAAPSDARERDVA